MERKNKKAVSLIVLVITVIVLSILAATVIISLSNTNIISEANETVKKANEKQIEEAKTLMYAEGMLGKRPEDMVIGDVTLKWDEESETVIEVRPNTEKEGVTIPGGFYYVGGTKDTGLVISDNSADENKGVDYTCEGNQFVWVPVDDYSKFVRGSAELDSNGIYKMTGTLDSNYVEPDIYNGYSSEATEYYKMKDSVERYGGFYIARFEAGNENDVVVSKKGVTVFNDVKWGDATSLVGTTGAVYLAQNMYKNSESVVSTLCYGVQWDAALNYISDAEHNIVDSSSWGNYSVSTGNAATNCGSLQKTGTNEAWQAKNIYDLAGNAVEWTMESGVGDDLVDTGGELVRVLRGGKYCDATMSGSSRLSRDPTSSVPALDASAHTWVGTSGFRVTLYVK